MSQNEEIRTITPKRTKAFISYLQEQEKGNSTIEAYERSLAALRRFLDHEPVSKTSLIRWKEALTQQYAPSSVNTMLAGVNAFLSFAGWFDFKLKPLKIQRSLFCGEEKELTREEYLRLVRAAEQEGNERLSFVLQTICATGIRVSELQFITIEAARAGRAVVNCKGKMRTIFLPKRLCRALMQYARKQQLASGHIFITKAGKPLNRSNIWRDMKSLCKRAGVAPEKVFPHNLRHLFARTYYALEKDLFRLADILGHSNVNTTRIYTIESGAIHAHRIEQMRLAVT